MLQANLTILSMLPGGQEGKERGRAVHKIKRETYADGSVQERDVEVTKTERLCVCVCKTRCAVLREVSQTSPLTWPGPLEPERKPC